MTKNAVTIYHNPRCSKSRQALQLIEERGVTVEVIRYLEDSPDRQTLREVLKKLGLSAKELVRKTESIYKEKYKGKELTEDEWIGAMVKHPKLIERPIVIKGNKAVVGRPPEKLLELL